MRMILSILVLAALIAGFKAAEAHDSPAASLKATSSTAQGAIDRRATSAPARNSLYACTTSQLGVALSRPWVNATGLISFAAKPLVDGAVAWSYGGAKQAVSGATRRILGNGLPNHSTGIYPVTPGTEAYTYDRNPNSIQANRFYIEVPAEPAEAATPNCLPMGAIGYALTGVALYNPLDAEFRDAVANEIFDACEGHPPQNGQYHYHHLSPCMDQGQAGQHSPLVGYALDGFGLYGPRGENGVALTNADLDECHGHRHNVTTGDGSVKNIYHYHGTEEFPYLLGCFKGTPVSAPRGLITPQTGFWSTSGVAGRGFAMEVQGSSMFIGIYSYSAAGAGVWHVGSCDLGVSSCAGSLQSFADGTSFDNLGVTPRTAQAASSPGSFTVSFASTSSANVTITPASGAAASYSLTRYALDGASVQTAASWAPQSGWWWSPAYPGTGWYIETQGSTVSGNLNATRIFAVGYAYGNSGGTGQANWYAGGGLMTQSGSAGGLWSGALTEYAGGPTLTGGGGAITTQDRGQASLTFTSATAATVVLPNGRQLALQRYGF